MDIYTAKEIKRIDEFFCPRITSLLALRVKAIDNVHRNGQGRSYSTLHPLCRMKSIGDGHLSRRGALSSRRRISPRCE